MGFKVFQGVDFVEGKPSPSGWKVGKVVQRPHLVLEEAGYVLVSLLLHDLGSMPSDQDAENVNCGKQFDYREPLGPVRRS